MNKIIGVSFKKWITQPSLQKVSYFWVYDEQLFLGSWNILLLCLTINKIAYCMSWIFLINYCMMDIFLSLFHTILIMCSTNFLPCDKFSSGFGLFNSILFLGHHRGFCYFSCAICKLESRDWGLSTAIWGILSSLFCNSIDCFVMICSTTWSKSLLTKIPIILFYYWKSALCELWPIIFINM